MVLHTPDALCVGVFTFVQYLESVLLKVLAHGSLRWNGSRHRCGNIESDHFKTRTAQKKLSKRWEHSCCVVDILHAAYYVIFLLLSLLHRILFICLRFNRHTLVFSMATKILRKEDGCLIVCGVVCCGSCRWSCTNVLESQYVRCIVHYIWHLLSCGPKHLWWKLIRSMLWERVLLLGDLLFNTF